MKGQLVQVFVLPGTWWHWDGEDQERHDALLQLFSPLLMQAGLGEWTPRVAVYRGTLLREWARSALDDLYGKFPNVKDGAVLPAIAWSAGLEVARIMEEIHYNETGRLRLWSVVGSLGGLPRTGVPTWQVFKICVKRFEVIFGGLVRGLCRYVPGLRSFLPEERQGMLWSEQAVAEDFFGSSPEKLEGLPAWRLLRELGQSPESFPYVASIFFPGVKEWTAHRPLRSPIQVLFMEGDPFVPPGTQYADESTYTAPITLPGVIGHAGFLTGEGEDFKRVLRGWGALLRSHQRRSMP